MGKKGYLTLEFQVLTKIKRTGEENSELLVVWLFCVHCTIDFKYLLHNAFHPFL